MLLSWDVKYLVILSRCSCIFLAFLMFQRYFMSVRSKPFIRKYVNIIFHINVCSVFLELSKLSEWWNCRRSQTHQAAEQMLSYVHTNPHSMLNARRLLRICIADSYYIFEISVCLDFGCINISILVPTRRIISEQ